MSNENDDQTEDCIFVLIHDFTPIYAYRTKESAHLGFIATLRQLTDEACTKPDWHDEDNETYKECISSDFAVIRGSSLYFTGCYIEEKK